MNTLLILAVIVIQGDPIYQCAGQRQDGGQGQQMIVAVDPVARATQIYGFLPGVTCDLKGHVTKKRWIPDPKPEERPPE